MPFHSCAEHRPLTIPLHLTLFCAIWASVCQLCPALDISSSTDLRQVFLGLPRLLFPWGVHFKACRVMLLGSFRSVCPIQVHFLLRVCSGGGSWLVCCQSSWLLMQFGHQILRILRRHLLMKDCMHSLVWWDICAPCLCTIKQTAFTLLFNILIFVGLDSSREFQIFRKRMCAVLILMSWSVPPLMSTILPK